MPLGRGGWGVGQESPQADLHWPLLSRPVTDFLQFPGAHSNSRDLPWEDFSGLPENRPWKNWVTLSPALTATVIVLSAGITGGPFVSPLDGGRAVSVFCSLHHPHSQLTPVVALPSDPWDSYLH